MNGIVNVYKEKGYTSHDVVAILRGILKTKKIGHAGTLDPDAEGVLLVCLGKATKCCQDLMGQEKRYRAQLAFGSETSTQDASGEVTRTYEYIYDEHRVKEAVDSFAGEYDQVPPMYSAIKKNGIKLYEMARMGEEIEREPRKVKIDAIELISSSEAGAVIDVSCSKGTYIRTLCEDIGRKTGYGAHMTGLVRLQSGRYSVETSHTISEIKALARSSQTDQFLITLDAYYGDYPCYHVPEEDSKYLYNGNPLTYPVSGMDIRPKDLIRMHDAKDELIGLYQAEWVTKTKVHLLPYKMFSQS